MKKITVFTKNNCIQCKMTKRFLEENNVDFDERNISEDDNAIDYLKGQGFQAVPVVEAPGFDTIAGFRPDMLKKLAV
ncbi:glutaredoxin-like protein NrdH [Dellaglioa sp. BT-FLS60]